MLNGVFDSVNLAIPHVRAGGRGGAIVIPARPRASTGAWRTETPGWWVTSLPSTVSSVWY